MNKREGLTIHTKCQILPPYLPNILNSGKKRLAVFLYDQLSNNASLQSLKHASKRNQNLAYAQHSTRVCQSSTSVHINSGQRQFGHALHMLPTCSSGKCCPLMNFLCIPSTFKLVDDE